MLPFEDSDNLSVFPLQSSWRFPIYILVVFCWKMALPTVQEWVNAPDLLQRGVSGISLNSSER